MGVRGLTSYIAQNAEKYLQPHELHDCRVVIDGDSLASNLYSWHSQCNSAFGGDYDQYFRCVVNFFAMLEKCNVTPYVLLDGGYERKKLYTVRQRLRSKIGAVKHINPFRCIPLFPLMLREVFIEAVKTTGCHLMRCLFEGDDEVSVLARKLNCPVLSYDSDFYIHNVLYIPSITLGFRVHKRKIPKKIRNKLSPDEENPTAYYFMDCSIYSVSNLVRNQLEANMLPLFATLLGNDYINGRLFRKFYANVSMKNIGKRSSPQQRRIVGLLRWLQTETVDSAIVKVLSRFEKERRPWMLRQIDAAMGGYNREDSKAYEFFGLVETVAPNSQQLCNSIENKYQITSDMDADDDEQEIDEFVDSETDDDDDNDEMGGEGECDKNEDGSDVEEVQEEQDTIDDNDEHPENALPNESPEEFDPPDWILQKVLAAEVPRFIVDLLHLKLYVNSPQIENFVLNDSNEIALPILQLIFTLLHHPEPNHFQYLTRVHRISNVHSKKIESVPLRTAFDPTRPNNIQIFGEIFDNFERKFELMAGLPENMRLFVMAMVYMSEKNANVAQPFYHSLLLGLLLLSKADEEVQPVTRDPRVLQKKYGSILESGLLKKPIDRNEECMETETDSAGQSITTNDSVFFLRNILPLFQISDKIREKHTDFSSTIVHTFAEFQAIIFNLNCLNSLLGRPFQPIFVSKSFNGTFLYNMYVHLRDRPNIDHYIRHHVFTDCERYYHFYTNILAICQSMIPCLTDMCDKSKKGGKATRNYRRNRRKQKLKTVTGNRHDEKIADEAFVDVESEDLQNGDGVQFTDSNNKFATLLNCN